MKKLQKHTCTLCKHLDKYFGKKNYNLLKNTIMVVKSFSFLKNYLVPKLTPTPAVKDTDPTDLLGYSPLLEA